MIEEETITQKPQPTTQPIIEKDYSYSLRDYPDKGNTGENPLYAVADLYYKLRLEEITSAQNLEMDILRKRQGVNLKTTQGYGVVSLLFLKNLYPALILKACMYLEV